MEEELKTKTEQLLSQVEANYRLQNELCRKTAVVEAKNETLDSLRRQLFNHIIRDGKEEREERKREGEQLISLPAEEEQERYRNISVEELLRMHVRLQMMKRRAPDDLPGIDELTGISMLEKARHEEPCQLISTSHDEEDTSATQPIGGRVGSEAVRMKRVFTAESYREMESKVQFLKESQQKLLREANAMKQKVATVEDTEKKLAYARNLNAELVSQADVLRETKRSYGSAICELKQKLVVLSKQLEKMVKHLEHESTEKLKCQDELKVMKDKLRKAKTHRKTIRRKSDQVHRLLGDTKKSSSILEDQLTLMDKKYIELRKTLDWTRANASKDRTKLQKEIDRLQLRLMMKLTAGQNNSSAETHQLPLVDPILMQRNT